MYNTVFVQLHHLGHTESKNVAVKSYRSLVKYVILTTVH